MLFLSNDMSLSSPLLLLASCGFVILIYLPYYYMQSNILLYGIAFCNIAFKSKIQNKVVAVVLLLKIFKM